MKNHDFTPKNQIFCNLRGGGWRAPGAPPPPGSAPDMYCVLGLSWSLCRHNGFYGMTLVLDDHLNHMRSLIVLSTKGNNLPFSQERRCHGYVKMTVSERWVYKPLRVHLSRGRETSAPRNVPFISPGFLSSLLSRMNGLWSGDSVDWLYRGCWK